MIIQAAKFDSSISKSEKFAVSLRKAKKQSRVQELRAKRISELYLHKKELSPMVISESGD